MNLILTLDAGTTALKTALFDLSGQMIGSRVREYSLEKPTPDRVELDPEVYWTAVKETIPEILAETKVDPARVTAVSVTGQGETLIPVDRNGKPLGKAIVWLDSRAAEGEKAIRKRFGVDEVYRVTGQQEISPAWPAAKILWLRENAPEVFRGTDKFLMVADFLVHRLTGAFATDRALNPSTLYYDMTGRCWWKPMLEFLGLSEERLPRLLDSGQAAGTVSVNVGLSRGTRVTVSPIDQITAAVGAGNIAPGTVTETTGSALALCATVLQPLHDPKKRIGLYCHAKPDRYALLPWSPTAGMILRWYRDEFDSDRDYPSIVRAASGIGPGCDGLLLLPHFSGMVCPDANADARGVLYGLTLMHGREHLARAILESTAYLLRDNLEALKTLGVECGGIVSLGGAARSALWLQIKADALGLPVATTQCEEAASLGAAVVAAAGTGLHPDLETAVKRMVRPGRRFEPDPGKREVYEALFRKYRDLNERLFARRREL